MKYDDYTCARPNPFTRELPRIPHAYTHVGRSQHAWIQPPCRLKHFSQTLRLHTFNTYSVFLPWSDLGQAPSLGSCYTCTKHIFATNKHVKYISKMYTYTVFIRIPKIHRVLYTSYLYESENGEHVVHVQSHYEQ